MNHKSLPKIDAIECIINKGIEKFLLFFTFSYLICGVRNSFLQRLCNLPKYPESLLHDFYNRFCVVIFGQIRFLTFVLENIRHT